MKKKPKNPKVVDVCQERSVLRTNLEISYGSKHQLDEILPFLVEKEFSFSFTTEFDGSKDVTILKIYNIHWANNATQIFEKLEKLDHQG